MLTDGEILNEIKEGEISIKPFKRKNLGPNSYDIRIADRIRSMKFTIDTVDLRKGDNYVLYDVLLPYTILPGETILFASKEILGCRSCTYGLLSPRSNLSRSGLIFQFSHLLDTGFRGVISGTIHNPTGASFVIPENLRIAQILFMRTDGRLLKGYNERKWSKNTKQFSIKSVKYKPDKEFSK